MTKNLLISFLILFSIKLSAQIQPVRMTEKFFPNPAIQIQTPTNQKPTEQGLCTYDEMISYLQSLTKDRKETVRMEMLGKTTKGNEIPILYFGEGKDPNKLNIWLQGGLHGNEPAGPEGLFMLMRYLLQTEKGALLLKTMDIAILPVANIDGYIAQKRTSANGYDLNRDQTKYSDPVSAVIKRAFVSWKPVAAFDFHEYQPIRKEFDPILEGGAAAFYDALFLPSTNLNIPACLRKMSVDLFQTNAENALNKEGYSHNFYFSAINEPDGIKLNKGAESIRSSSTSYALSNSISILVEIRGIGLGRTSFARRTNSCFLVAKSFLETAAGHKKELKKCVAIANKQTVKRINDIVVTADKKLVTYPMKFIDISKNELVNLDMKVYDGSLSFPTLVRKRPVAYLLLPECKAEVERLRILGVKVEETEKSITIPVENYMIIKKVEETVKWEGIYPVQVEATLNELTKTFPAGSYVIRLAQENANFAVTLLEPESENGFVNYCVTKSAIGSELPVYRFVSGKLPEIRK